ncbi:hypothetical protein [Lactobacillus porci]|uniref:hypothetical protein n=1 Tax=Lactobacillus porci TaxID=2012477 RepID=UPI0039911345
MKATKIILEAGPTFQEGANNWFERLTLENGLLQEELGHQEDGNALLTWSYKTDSQKFAANFAKAADLLEKITHEIRDYRDAADDYLKVQLFEGDSKTLNTITEFSPLQPEMQELLRVLNAMVPTCEDRLLLFNPVEDELAYPVKSTAEWNAKADKWLNQEVIFGGTISAAKTKLGESRFTVKLDDGGEVLVKYFERDAAQLFEYGNGLTIGGRIMVRGSFVGKDDQTFVVIPDTIYDR